MKNEEILKILGKGIDIKVAGVYPAESEAVVMLETIYKRVAEQEKERMDAVRKKLLEHYSQKTPSDFLQYDAFVDIGAGDSFMSPNPETGVCVGSGPTTELMDTCNEVRVLISKQATKSEALRGIKEIFNAIKAADCKKDESLYQSDKDRSDRIHKQMEINRECDEIPF